MEEEITTVMDQKPNFEKDVFISYAHVDNKPNSVQRDAKGWISNFHYLLQNRLNQLISKELTVWFDEKDLEGNSVFGKEIRKQFPQLKVMVSILTPGYFKSDWCKDEMDEFYQAASKNLGVNIGNHSRIFKVVKTPYYDEEEIRRVPPTISEVINDTLDFKFYIQESKEKFSELTPEGSLDNPSTKIFMSKLEDVAQGISKLLKKLDKVGVIEEDEKLIYLAETSYDLQDYREKLARQLEDTGFHVLPDRKLPNVAKDYAAAVEGYMDKSILSLHLISPNIYGATPEGSIKSKVIIQNEIAAKKSKSLNRLIWIPPALEQTDAEEETIEMQHAFLKKLKEAKADDSQFLADILEGKTLHEFAEAITNKVKAMEEAEKAKKEAEEKAKKEAEEKAKMAIQSPGTAVNTEIKKVYLVCSSADLDNTGPLRKLIKKNGCSVLLPQFEGTAQDMQKQHIDMLTLCDGVIIYYGAGNDLWTDKKVSDIMGLVREASKPILAKTIFTTGEDDDGSKKEYSTPGINKIDGLAGFNEDSFYEFFQKLK